MAGGSPEADTLESRGFHPEVAFVAVVCGAASIFFGIIPEPLFQLVHDAGSALPNIL
jgi:hypothetical protein